MAVTIDQATSTVEATGSGAAPAGAPPAVAEGRPSAAELQRMAGLMRAMERDRKRLCAEGFDD